jgi:hypothetical protein
MKPEVPDPVGQHSTLFVVFDIKFISTDSRIGHWKDRMKAHLKNVF